ncbi:MAG: Nuclear control of ATPase protein 2 [Alyxoria varia]|nr:MAG: Nuclear control of ATPase protein 2 [Alyxoria varia]
MSFVEGHVTAVASRLDSLQLAGLSPEDENEVTDRAKSLQLEAAGLSVRNKLTARNIVDLLADANLSHHGIQGSSSALEQSLEWSVVAKAALRTYELVLHSLLARTVITNEEILYWRSVRTSNRYTGLYLVQKAPLLLWSDTIQAVTHVNEGSVGLQSLWQRFYRIAREVARPKPFKLMRNTVVGPINIAREEIEQKERKLEHVRQRDAAILGGLVSDCFTFASGPEAAAEWGYHILQSLSTTHTLLNESKSLERSSSDIEAMLENRSREVYVTSTTSHGITPLKVSKKIFEILLDAHPGFSSRSNGSVSKNSRPSVLVRYWLPGVIGLFSSTTILRILFNRKEAIVTWIRDFGSVAKDFWFSWVVEPTKKLIGTIRHDKNSQLSVASKKSLEGDQASLERMVVDFVVDNPAGPSLGESEIADIKAKVHDGDLTHILKAYEKELKSPLYGSVMGNLIRTLLIQIQKTKVDVEVAMGGIDSLLKSQEPLFGNIDRIIFRSKKRGDTMGYEEFGSLVHESTILRDMAEHALPKMKFQEFLDDMDELMDRRVGVENQRDVLRRIRWAYAAEF